MNKPLLINTVFFLLLTFGCIAPQSRREVKTIEIDSRIPLSELSSSLESKMSFFNSLLEENTHSEEDQKIASDLLKVYKQLYRLSSAHPTVDQCYAVIQDLFQCLSFFDEKYFSMSQETTQDYSTVISLLANKKADILNAYVSGDYGEVMDLCIELKNIFGPDALTPDVGLLFALALAKNAMPEEAINLGERISRELETAPDAIHLRAKIADWYLQKGQLEKALAAYEKLTDIMDEQQMAIHSLSRKIAAAKKSRNIREIPGDVKFHHEEENIDHLLRDVEKLLEENRFSEARNLLYTISEDTLLTSEAQRNIRLALNKLERAESHYLEEKMSMLSMKKDMEHAKRLIEEEKFEEVISKLETLETEPEDSREIKELKQFAIEKLINRERNRAAKIFLKAKEMHDPAKKEQYLNEAYKILNLLIEKYPLSPQYSKIKLHIKIVEDEFDKLEKNTGQF